MFLTHSAKKHNKGGHEYMHLFYVATLYKQNDYCWSDSSTRYTEIPLDDSRRYK